ncbi:MAG: hypothetical protein K2I46_05225 [Clostridia bacterium]|nr:hypothetical protein [Clostridia bacterium]
MKNMKKIIFAMFIVVLMISALCACIPEKTQEEIISLKGNYEVSGINIGRYKIVSINQQINSSSCIYEVRPGKQEGLLDLFRNNEYFVGEFEVPSCLAFEINSQGIYVGKKAIWLAKEGNLWVVQSYGQKRVNALLIDYEYIRNEENTLIAGVSKALLSSSSDSYNFGKDYATPFRWSQLKNFYSQARVNEEEKSILVDCQFQKEGEFLFNGKGMTKLFFDEINKTFRVSADYSVT